MAKENPTSDTSDELLLLDSALTNTVALHIPWEKLGIAQDFTVRAWIKTDKWASQTILKITPKSNKNRPIWGAPGRSFELRGALVLDIFNAGSVYGKSAVCDGTWHHIAIVHKATTNEISFFVDGVLDGTSKLPSSDKLSKHPSAMFVLAGGNDDESRFEGEIQDMRWTSRALDQAVIAREVQVAPPVPHWKPLPVQRMDLTGSEFCANGEASDSRYERLICAVGPKAIDKAVESRSDSQRLSRRPGSQAPVIAIGVASTTFKVDRPAFDNLVLFTKTIPSIRDNLEKGFEYWIYLVYDRGDPWFDQGSKHTQDIQRHLDQILVQPLKSKQIICQVVLMDFDNSLLPEAKPGPVFNFMMKAAFADGADYLYRTNDDTTFSSPFASVLVGELGRLNPPNVGVAGPTHKGGNLAILTHDFVHRTHLEIFKTYYPTRFNAWYGIRQIGLPAYLPAYPSFCLSACLR